MSALLELAARVEAAEGEEQYKLLRLVWDHLNPQPPREPEEARDEWAYAQRCYRHLLDAGGFLDAAMLLVPEGRILRRYIATRYVPHGCEVAVDWAHGGWTGKSDHSFALALCAAALRARAAMSGERG